MAPTPEDTTLWVDLVANLSDPDPQARIDAIRAIVGVAGDMVARAIRGVLDDESAKVRRFAARTVGEMSSGSEADSNMRCLIMLFRDEDRSVRTMAAEAVAALGSKLGVKTVLTEIIPLLQSSEAPVRAGAARVVADLGAPAGTDSVIALLGNLMADENGEVRHAAVVAVRRIGYKAASDTVVKNFPPLLQDPDEVVQHDAAWAIGRLGKAAATEANLSGLLGLRDSGCGGDQWIAGIGAFRALRLKTISSQLWEQLAEMLQDENICVQNYAGRIRDILWRRDFR